MLGNTNSGSDANKLSYTNSGAIAHRNIIPYPYGYSLNVGDTYTDGGVTYTIEEDGSVTVKGQAAADSGIYLFERNRFPVELYQNGIPLKLTAFFEGTADEVGSLRVLIAHTIADGSSVIDCRVTNQDTNLAQTIFVPVKDRKYGVYVQVFNDTGYNYNTKVKFMLTAAEDPAKEYAEPKISTAYLMDYIDKLHSTDIGISHEIKSGDDLDDYRIPGEYWCRNGTVAKSLANCPSGVAFRLIVTAGNDVLSSKTLYGSQIIIAYEVIYIRAISGSTSYGSWHTVSAKQYGITAYQSAKTTKSYTLDQTKAYIIVKNLVNDTVVTTIANPVCAVAAMSADDVWKLTRYAADLTISRSGTTLSITTPSDYGVMVLAL